ncbi:hypothetical protein L1077_14990 [Pseudoalteromonas luteoviolacea]|uniref:hypothetical protein n=1 Tax=Pseudoalteromonas luteoviolacea TaxID=43657 RepID=UPI001F260DA2|nr:hypothetical protein [Pseudoalteromonas luteoviolacea]MCF6440740.1 hypothetical protein [Pseudoalteromonas luteoviolacea]
MSLKLNINFLPDQFPRALSLWEMVDMSRALTEIEGLTKLVNIDTCRTIKVENYVKSKDKARTRPGIFSIGHPSREYEGTHGVVFMPMDELCFDQLLIYGFDKLIEQREQWWQSVLQHSGFVMARLMDDEYNTRQSMRHIGYYESHGWPHHHLPKISNGKPPPIDQIDIDTRVNPGHWRFKPGYIEGVSAEMWLGKHFFKHVGLDKQALYDVDWLEVTELDNVIHIKAYDKPFDSDVGVQRTLQIKLRKLLFGQSPHTEDPEFKMLSEFQPLEQ